MLITNYLFSIVGENPQTISKLHKSTITRTKAFAIAIHIPVFLWIITGFAIAKTIFELDNLGSSLVGVFCGLLIFLIERIVLATPKKWYVNIVRLMIGVIIAILGASTVDLVIFKKEVTYQLRKNEEIRINKEYDEKIKKLIISLNVKKSDWLKAQEAANCEANGQCGSKTKSLGPIYMALKKQADLLQQDYFKYESFLESLYKEKTDKLESAKNNVINESGLLARIQALHSYTVENRAAMVGWTLFFSLILFFELVVVLAKIVFTETVDDEIEKVREAQSHYKAQVFMDALKTPQVYRAAQLIDAA